MKTHIKTTKFGIWLKHERKIREMTLIQVAKAIGLKTPQTIHAFESRGKFPAKRHLTPIGKLFRTPKKVLVALIMEDIGKDWLKRDTKRSAA